eukprot:scaffold639_cov65-Phaeocystis_antarctica.AAC.3
MAEDGVEPLDRGEETQHAQRAQAVDGTLHLLARLPEVVRHSEREVGAQGEHGRGPCVGVSHGAPIRQRAEAPQLEAELAGIQRIEDLPAGRLKRLQIGGVGGIRHRRVGDDDHVHQPLRPHGTQSPSHALAQPPSPRPDCRQPSQTAARRLQPRAAPVVAFDVCPSIAATAAAATAAAAAATAHACGYQGRDAVATGAPATEARAGATTVVVAAVAASATTIGAAAPVAAPAAVAATTAAVAAAAAVVAVIVIAKDGGARLGRLLQREQALSEGLDAEAAYGHRGVGAKHPLELGLRERHIEGRARLAREQREDGALHALQQQREVLQRDEAVGVEVEQPKRGRHRLLTLAPRALGAGKQLGLVLAEDGGEDEVGEQEEAKDEEGHEEERGEAVLLVCWEHDIGEVGRGE